jgi:hypothetical protein
VSRARIACPFGEMATTTMSLAHSRAAPGTPPIGAQSVFFWVICHLTVVRPRVAQWFGWFDASSPPFARSAAEGASIRMRSSSAAARPTALELFVAADCMREPTMNNAATDSTPAIVINVAVTASTMPNPRSLLEFRI